MDIGGQSFERQSAALIKREALHLDVKVIILQLRQGEVGTQVGHCQMVRIQTAWFARLVKDIVGQCRLAYHHRLDLHIKRLGRLVILGFEGVDDKLQIGGAVLVGACHTTIQTDNFAIGNHNAMVGYQLLETDARPQLLDSEQRAALLVFDLDILEFQLVKRSYRYRAYLYLGIKKFA